MLPWGRGPLLAFLQSVPRSSAQHKAPGSAPNHPCLSPHHAGTSALLPSGIQPHPCRLRCRERAPEGSSGGCGEQSNKPHYCGLPLPSGSSIGSPALPPLPASPRGYSQLGPEDDGEQREGHRGPQANVQVQQEGGHKRHDPDHLEKGTFQLWHGFPMAPRCGGEQSPGAGWCPTRSTRLDLQSVRKSVNCLNMPLRLTMMMADKMA